MRMIILYYTLVYRLPDLRRQGVLPAFDREIAGATEGESMRTVTTIAGTR